MIVWRRQNFNVCVVRVCGCVPLPEFDFLLGLSCFSCPSRRRLRSLPKRSTELMALSWSPWRRSRLSGTSDRSEGTGFLICVTVAVKGKVSPLNPYTPGFETGQKRKLLILTHGEFSSSLWTDYGNWQKHFQHDCILSSLIFFPEKGRKWLWTSHGKWKTTRNCWFLWVFINPKWLLAFDSYSFWDLHVLRILRTVTHHLCQLV